MTSGRHRTVTPQTAETGDKAAEIALPNSGFRWELKGEVRALTQWKLEREPLAQLRWRATLDEDEHYVYAIAL